MRLPLLLALAGALFAAEFKSNEYLDYVKFLASPEMKGRATGSPELERAADFIAGQFRSMGLKPIHSKSYFQDFEVTTSARLGPGNQFSYTSSRHKTTLKPQQDFVPMNLSTAGRVSGSMVFAGYGITAPEYHYDDYAGIDVKGKIVLLLRHEPQESDEKSVFDGKSFTQHAQFTSKSTNAKIHGAVGVILINDLANHR